MEENKKEKLDTEPYKGVRDFFPEDMAVQNHIFGVMRSVAESFGYAEYGASVLESAALYRAKSGEEIVNEQTYTFVDRGQREVTLRPEMTPTLARMVAGKKKSLVFPLRWYSIPNLFRYEQPQRGRIREHWQLNADIFGVSTTEAEVEIISMAFEIMKRFGLKETDFEIRINSRKIVNAALEYVFKLSADKSHKVGKLLDKKEKMPPETFKEAVAEFLGNETDKFITMMNSKNLEEFASHLPETPVLREGIEEVKKVMDGLETLGITNTVFCQTLMRGFDYYTGTVFEIFDKNPANKRSLFGGGRYDNLLSIFGNDRVPAVGFGAGDLTIKDVLETYGLIPEVRPSADLAICLLDIGYASLGNEIAQKMRRLGIRSMVDYSDKKIGDQIKTADKLKIPFVICIGEDEEKSGDYKIKDMLNKTETVLREEKLADFLKARM